MIAQWDSSLSNLPRGPGSISSHDGQFKEVSLADHTLPIRPEPAWQKMAQSPLNGTT